MAVVAMVAARPAAAEFACAPAGAASAYPTSDPNWPAEVAAWSKITANRYLEGGKDACKDASVIGYAGFPTKLCRYASADAGAGSFAMLSAQVVLLDPSAVQLAAWSINACRAEGAVGASMLKCLAALRGWVVSQNGAQFAILGSAVESRCNSSPSNYPQGCSALAPADPGRRPRHIWFRDGVSVDYRSAAGVHWDSTAYGDGVFARMLDPAQSDPWLNTTYVYARVAGATRDEWRAWRKLQGLPPVPAGMTETDLEAGGWRTISRDAHKAACQGAEHALFNARVHAMRKTWIGGD